MSRIRGFNTGIEVLVRNALRQRGFRFKTHVMSLPGRPDFVFLKPRLTVFVDGDFWHGFRYPQWKSRLPRWYWRAKIERNRRRDRLNHQRLRRSGWLVLRFWGHQVCGDLEGCVDRIATAIAWVTDSARQGRVSVLGPGSHNKKRAKAKALA